MLTKQEMLSKLADMRMRKRVNTYKSYMEWYSDLSDEELLVQHERCVSIVKRIEKNSFIGAMRGERKRESLSVAKKRIGAIRRLLANRMFSGANETRNLWKLLRRIQIVNLNFVCPKCGQGRKWKQTQWHCELGVAICCQSCWRSLGSKEQLRLSEQAFFENQTLRKQME